MSGTFTELVVEQAALAWLKSIGWHAAEREGYGQVGPAQRVRESSLPRVFGELRLMVAARFIGRAV